MVYKHLLRLWFSQGTCVVVDYWVLQYYLQGGSGDTDIKNRLVDTVREGRVGRKHT